MSYFETRKRAVGGWEGGKREGYGAGFMSILVGNLGTWEPPTNLDIKPYLVALESLILTT